MTPGEGIRQYYVISSGLILHHPSCRSVCCIHVQYLEIAGKEDFCPVIKCKDFSAGQVRSVLAALRRILEALSEN